MANKRMTVKDMATAIKNFCDAEGMDYKKAEVWLSSDEEGNSYAPLMQYGKMINMGIEKDKNRIILYPSHCDVEY